MDITDSRGIRDRAGESLKQTAGAKKLVLIYSGVLLGINLLLTLVRFILGRQIGAAEGLATMDLRSLLQTVKTVLGFAANLLMPFWEAGLVYAAILIYRRQDPDTRALFRGFHRLGTVFLILLLQSIALNIIALACLQLSAVIFMSSSLSATFKELVEPILAAGPEAVIDTALSGAIMGEIIPMILVFAGLFLAAIILLMYRFRMATYLAVDENRCGAMEALTGSWRMTRKNCRSLFKLDLGFWWYYLGQAVLSAICYGDAVLALVGVQIPMAADAAAMVFYTVYTVLNLGFLYLAKLPVEVTYAGAYDALLEQSARALPEADPYL